LYFYGARCSALGRFIQADSIIPDQKGPQSWDRYSYALNNPVKYNDPSGHCPWCLIGGAVGAIVGAVAYTATHPGDRFDTGQMLMAAGGGALIGSGAVIFAPVVAAAAGDLLVGTGLAAGSTALFGAGVSAYEASTALGNALEGSSAIPTAQALNSPNEIGAWGEQQVGENLPVNIQHTRIIDPVTGRVRIYDGNFYSDPERFVEVKTSIQGIVYARQMIRDQIATDSNISANYGTSPTWIFVNAKPSRPLVNLMQQNRIPWHQLHVPME
jgi:hypothetical protein